MVFHTRNGNFALSVEVADEPSEQFRGLMNRTSLAPNFGMLFVFKSEEERYFWMKDTLIPLDMIFIHANGTVSAILKNAQPCNESCPFLDSGVPSSYVVEANAGYSVKIGLAVNDTVSLPVAG